MYYEIEYDRFFEILVYNDRIGSIRIEFFYSVGMLSFLIDPVLP